MDDDKDVFQQLKTLKSRVDKLENEYRDMVASNERTAGEQSRRIEDGFEAMKLHVSRTQFPTEEFKEVKEGIKLLLGKAKETEEYRKLRERVEKEIQDEKDKQRKERIAEAGVEKAETEVALVKLDVKRKYQIPFLVALIGALITLAAMAFKK